MNVKSFTHTYRIMQIIIHIEKLYWKMLGCDSKRILKQIVN